jgi:hypothetical protein
MGGDGVCGEEEEVEEEREREQRGEVRRPVVREEPKAADRCRTNGRVGLPPGALRAAPRESALSSRTVSLSCGSDAVGTGRTRCSAGRGLGPSAGSGKGSRDPVVHDEDQHAVDRRAEQVHLAEVVRVAHKRRDHQPAAPVRPCGAAPVRPCGAAPVRPCGAAPVRPCGAARLGRRCGLHGVCSQSGRRGCARADTGG